MAKKPPKVTQNVSGCRVGFKESAEAATGCHHWTLLFPEQTTELFTSLNGLGFEGVTFNPRLPGVLLFSYTFVVSIIIITIKIRCKSDAAWGGLVLSVCLFLSLLLQSSFPSEGGPLALLFYFFFPPFFPYFFLLISSIFF